jgi:DNA-binding response OmpR family regulator
MAKVLIVDDDESVVRLLEKLLQDDGHETRAALDGKQGLLLARQETPELIILDVMMPLMDGFTVSGLLFQDPVLKQVPVIILTAQGSSRPILELVPNVRLYMDKPFDPKQLRENVRNLLAYQGKSVS